MAALNPGQGLRDRAFAVDRAGEHFNADRARARFTFLLAKLVAAMKASGELIGFQSLKLNGGNANAAARQCPGPHRAKLVQCGFGATFSLVLIVWFAAIDAAATAALALQMMSPSSNSQSRLKNAQLS